ncbi:MAG: arsenical pump-driving ATPase [Balneolaceae bacterium]
MQLKKLTPFIFFTGKGGVGKTTMACATAVKMADEGRKTLLISTDPASNLKDVLQADVSDEIQKVEGFDHFDVVNIDPEIAAEEYRDRVMKPLEEIISGEEIAKMREELSGACTTEIAAFDEFARFVSAEDEEKKYDVVIFDTAPTGHTLRLLELPAAWSEFIEKNPQGASCLGPTSALKTSQERYKKVVARLQDATETTVYLVSRPETSALKEAARSSVELDELGLSSQFLLINGYFEPMDESDPIAVKMSESADKAIQNMPEKIRHLDRQIFPLRSYNVLGIEKLRNIFEPLEKVDQNSLNEPKVEADETLLPDLNKLIDEVTQKDHGLIMLMGKGGVGKTVMASTIALKLAKKGFPVHLTTTDPAAHIQEQFDGRAGEYENLTIDQINPKEETRRYIEKVMEQKGENMDENGRKLLREDLESPCTEEVAVFHAFSKAIHEAKRKFVVIDTAPTGHTLLLLDTAGSYHKEVLRKTTFSENKLKTPYMYLQDKDFAKILLVSLAETTPISEAAKLQDDLRRANINPYGWIINQSMAATEVKDPLLRQRAKSEIPLLQKVREKHTDNLFGVPWIDGEQVAWRIAELKLKELV